MKVGDLVRFKDDSDMNKIFGLPPRDLKVVLSEPQRAHGTLSHVTWVMIYYLEGPRAGQKNPCDIDELEVVSASSR